MVFPSHDQRGRIIIYRTIKSSGSVVAVEAVVPIAPFKAQPIKRTLLPIGVPYVTPLANTNILLA